MKDVIIEIINQFGYIGVFLLTMVENVFPPLPSEIILTFGGFMTTYSQINIWGVILAATIGSVAGAIILYIIGRVLNVDRLEQIISGRTGKILRLKKGDMKRAEKWFLQCGYKAVFFCRFIPIVRSLISIPAGAAKMKIVPFIALTTIGTFIWNMVLIFLGRLMGEAWETAAHYIDVYSMIVVIVLVLVSIILSVVFIKKRFLNKDEDALSISSVTKTQV